MTPLLKMRLTSNTNYETSVTMNLLKKAKMIFNRPVVSVYNEAGERIESLRFTVPALRVGVLEYAPGQLTTNNAALDGKTVKLYYPPEAVSDKKFLKSLENAPVVVGGHDSTTNEHNKKIDGWAHTVNYDAARGAAMIAGVVKGNKEVAYIKTNLGQSDFGASAFVDIFDIEVKNGITPDGQEYNAIAKDLRATHVALAQHVRDPQNKIKVTNAVVVNADGEYNSEVKQVELTADQIAAIVENAVSKAVTAKNSEDRMDKLEKMIATLANAVEELKEEMKDDEKKEDKKADGENADEEKKEEAEKKEEEKEGETVKNAKPSQALVAAFSTALNIDFGSKTPSFATLAALSGITEKDPFMQIAAVNAKFAELEKSVSVKNTDTLSSKEVF